MSDTIMNDATSTEVDIPQDETAISDGQVVETGEAVASDASYSDDDLFNYDEYTDKLVKIKVDGEEVVVPLSEALAGYQRQADYTRKTQELSEQRKQTQYGAALQEALENDPYGTLQLLQQHYGVQEVQALEDDPYADPVMRELDELKAWKAQLEHERTLSTIENELNSLEAKYGDDFDREEVIAKALAIGSSDLEATFKMIHFDRVYAEKKAAEKKQAELANRTEAKKNAQIVSGTSTSKGQSTAPVSSPKTVLDAWKNAEKQLGI